MKFKTEIINGKELAERFKKSGRKIQDKIDKALYKAGLLVERMAKILVHVDTGRCRASITTRLAYANAEVGTIVEYAPKSASISVCVHSLVPSSFFLNIFFSPQLSSITCKSSSVIFITIGVLTYESYLYVVVKPPEIMSGKITFDSK